MLRRTIKFHCAANALTVLSQIETQSSYKRDFVLQQGFPVPLFECCVDPYRTNAAVTYPCVDVLRVNIYMTREAARPDFQSD